MGLGLSQRVHEKLSVGTFKNSYILELWLVKLNTTTIQQNVVIYKSICVQVCVRF